MTVISPELQVHEEAFVRQSELLDGWVDLGRQIAVLEARRAEILAERMDMVAWERSLTPGTDEIAFRSMFSEYAAAGRLSPQTASRQITDAWMLVRMFPATLAALESGAISRQHANAIVDEAPPVSGRPDAQQVRAEYEQLALPFAETKTPAQTRVHAREVCAKVSPESAQERHRRARSDRSVKVKSDGDGAATLIANLPELLAYAIQDRLTAMSKELIDARPKGQRRPRQTAIAKIRAERAAAISAEEPSTPELPIELEEEFRNRMAPRAPWESPAEASDPGAWATAGLDDPAATPDGTATATDGRDGEPVIDESVFYDESIFYDESTQSDGSVSNDGSTRHDAVPMHDGYGPVEPDTRSMDQLRADLLADLLLTASPSSVTDTALGSIRASVQVTIAASTLAGHDNAMAEFDGHGPLDPDVARILAGQASSWDRLFLDPSGMAVETDNYVPTAGMKRYLRIRDQHCRFPGCRAPAHRCQIDHNHDHAKGGPTALCNLALMCEGHHPLKHPDVDVRDRWTAKQIDSGVILWTSPLGRIYTDEPQLRVMFV